MKKDRINAQTEQNKKRKEMYDNRMALWVVAKGITHRAVELKYFGTDSYTALRNKLNNNLNNSL